MMAENEDMSTDLSDHENPFYLEACSHHIINKLMQSSEYEIHKNLKKEITSFRNNFRNISESSGLIPLPMKNVM